MSSAATAFSPGPPRDLHGYNCHHIHGCHRPWVKGLLKRIFITITIISKDVSNKQCNALHALRDITFSQQSNFKEKHNKYYHTTLEPVKQVIHGYIINVSKIYNDTRILPVFVKSFWDLSVVSFVADKRPTADQFWAHWLKKTTFTSKEMMHTSTRSMPKYSCHCFFSFVF